MATFSIRYEHKQDGVRTAASYAILRDPTRTFGLRRIDVTPAQIIIPASSTAFTFLTEDEMEAGVYTYTFADLLDGALYEYALEVADTIQVFRPVQRFRAGGGRKFFSTIKSAARYAGYDNMWEFGDKDREGDTDEISSAAKQAQERSNARIHLAWRQYLVNNGATLPPTVTSGL
jgi:hypothetical protein